MPLTPVRLGLIAVASPLEVGAGEAPALLDGLGRSLRDAGHRPVEVAAARLVTDAGSAVAAGRLFHDLRVDAVAAVAASWFEDYLVLDMLEECQVPLIAWARPGMQTGSLCGMQQLAFMLKQLGHPHCFLFEPVGAGAACVGPGTWRPPRRCATVCAAPALAT